MTATKPDQDFASTQEVAAAFQQLSTADLVRLKRIAELRSTGLSTLDWRDLVNEAVRRALTGARHWPKSVPFIAFLAQTIRSVAGDEWRRLQESPVLLESDLQREDEDENPVSLADLAVDAINPEREVAARQALKMIEATFKDDPDALKVIDGLARGLTPSEVQADGRMSSTQYSSTQRRIRRRLAQQGIAKEER